MNYLKKTIFLSNNEKSKGMATLTLESKNKSIFGTIKMYSNYKGEYILGIKCKDKIIKQNINMENSIYSFIIDKIDLSENLGCVILDTKQGSAQPILWGCEKNENYKSQIISSLKNSISKISNSLSTKATPIMETTKVEDTNKEHEKSEREKIEDENISEKMQEDNENISNTINSDEEMSIEDIYESIEDIPSNTDDSANKYSQIALDEETINNQEEIAVASAMAEDLFTSTDEEVEEIINNEIGLYPRGRHQFYDMISEQLEELFSRYPKEENLCKLIENSNWVKIDTEIDNKYHVVGIISDSNDIRYICYGVPGSYNIEPPSEMRNYSQWLPTDTLDPYNNGYWVMYQDVDTGENVLMN